MPGVLTPPRSCKRSIWAATSCGIVYTSFSVGTLGGTRGETRPGGEQGGGDLPRSGGGGGGNAVGTGGRRNTCDEVAELAGSRSGVRSIASTPESISGDGGGARVPSRGIGDGSSWVNSLAGRASINVEAKPPARRRRTRRATSCWSKPHSSLFTLATMISLEPGPSSTFIASAPASKASCRRLPACKATILRCTEDMNWRSARTRLLFLGRLATGRTRAEVDARAEGGTRAPLRRRRASTGRGRLRPGGGSCAGICSHVGAVGKGTTFSSRCEVSRGVDETGFHERKAVVLVRATVADAF